MREQDVEFGCETGMLNISDMHWKLKIKHMSSVNFHLVNLVENLCWK